MSNSHIPKSDILAPQEIADSIDASQNLLAIIDYINAIQHRSQVKALRRSLVSVTAKNRFNPDEVDVIVAAMDARDFELSARSIGYQAAWSPSANIPPDRESDWRERQMPRGDRV